jgi:indole-3-glycerol phosphate synthase
MDPVHARSILQELPKTATRIHLSGLKSADDIRAVSHSGADAALIGEVLMRLDDPLPTLASLVQAARD